MLPDVADPETCTVPAAGDGTVTVTDVVGTAKATNGVSRAEQGSDDEAESDAQMHGGPPLFAEASAPDTYGPFFGARQCVC